MRTRSEQQNLIAKKLSFSEASTVFLFKIMKIISKASLYKYLHAISQRRADLVKIRPLLHLQWVQSIAALYPMLL